MITLNMLLCLMVANLLTFAALSERPGAVTVCTAAGWFLIGITLMYCFLGLAVPRG